MYKRQELAIELLRIATIHTPTSLSNAMGMIAAVLLGQFAIDLGIFSEEILLFCAIGDVGGFATPNYELSLTNKYLIIFLIIFVGFLGWIGFVIYHVILIGYLAVSYTHLDVYKRQVFVTGSLYFISKVREYIIDRS